MPDTASSPRRHLVDPELLDLLTLLPSIELSRSTLQAVRAAPPSFDLGEINKDDGVRLGKRLIAGPKGAPSVPVLIYTPAILHSHDGGYISGDAKFMEPWHRRRQLSVDAQRIGVMGESAGGPRAACPGSSRV